MTGIMVKYLVMLIFCLTKRGSSSLSNVRPLLHPLSDYHQLLNFYARSRSKTDKEYQTNNVVQKFKMH